MTATGRKAPELRLLRLAALLGLALAACGNDPVLRSVAIGSGTGKVFVAVGETQQLTLMGTYSDGSTSPVTKDVTWTSSDPLVASLEPTGLVVPWAKGTAQISATHGPSGLGATAALTSRVVITVPAGSALPYAGAVDTEATYFRVTGLTPGTMYTPSLSQMTDDVDLYVFTDLSQETKLCDSDYVGALPDWCVAPANPSGELWVTADGQWTSAGAQFALDVPATSPVALEGTLASAQLPYSGSVGATKKYFEITGLLAGADYEVRISNLTSDIDVGVYADVYRYQLLCESYELGTVDDLCTAKAGAAGDLVVEIDGETTPSGGPFTLSVTAK